MIIWVYKYPGRPVRLEREATGHKSHIFLTLNYNGLWAPVRVRLRRQTVRCCSRSSAERFSGFHLDQARQWTNKPTNTTLMSSFVQAEFTLAPEGRAQHLQLEVSECGF